MILLRYLKSSRVLRMYIIQYTHFFTPSQSQCRSHQYKLYKAYVNFSRCKKVLFQFVLLMCGILCLRSYCSVVPYKRSSVIWTCVCITGDILELSRASFPVFTLSQVKLRIWNWRCSLQRYSGAGRYLHSSVSRKHLVSLRKGRGRGSE